MRQKFYKQIFCLKCVTLCWRPQRVAQSFEPKFCSNNSQMPHRQLCDVAAAVAVAAVAVAEHDCRSKCFRAPTTSDNKRRPLSEHFSVSLAGMSRVFVVLAMCCFARAFAALQPTNLGDDELSALSCVFNALHLVNALLSLMYPRRPHPPSAFMRHQLAESTHRAESAPSSKLDLCV